MWGNWGLHFKPIHRCAGGIKSQTTSYFTEEYFLLKQNDPTTSALIESANSVLWLKHTHLMVESLCPSLGFSSWFQLPQMCAFKGDGISSIGVPATHVGDLAWVLHSLRWPVLPSASVDIWGLNQQIGEVVWHLVSLHSQQIKQINKLFLEVITSLYQCTLSL